MKTTKKKNISFAKNGPKIISPMYENLQLFSMYIYIYKTPHNSNNL